MEIIKSLLKLVSFVWFLMRMPDWIFFMWAAYFGVWAIVKIWTETNTINETQAPHES